MMTRKIYGKEAEKLLYEQINEHSGGIKQALASLDAESAVMVWFDTFRSIEEFINLPLFSLDDDALGHMITNYRLDTLDQDELHLIQNGLKEELDSGVINRFMITIIQAAAIGKAFYLNGFMGAASGLQTVEHAIDFFQSRRRHLLALLYTIPTSCYGTNTVNRNDTLNVFLPHIEHSGLTLTGLHQQIMLAKVFNDFMLEVDDLGFSANYHYEPLDSSFLEPERVNIMELRKATSDSNICDKMRPVDPRLIFSVNELLNNIRLIELAYDEFDLSSTSFAHMASFVRECVAFCEDDYFVKLDKAKFEKIAEDVKLTSAMRRKLIHCRNDYVANLDEFSPFIDVDEIYISSVTLLSRFLYYWRAVCLNRTRRFQIRSGYILESSVKDSLAKQGFNVTGIKRVNRKEFDVVALLDGVVYNIQCKNNLIDLSKIEADPARFARYNRQLDRYYARALIKEEEREYLLREKLGLSEVRHFVVSRFPVATKNQRVISYSNIDKFRYLVLDMPS